jgi:hypothetical protein
MKPRPRTTQAMRNLILEVRTALPLDVSPDEICTDECRGCSIKLIDYIAMEMDYWEYRLDDGVIPTFGDLDKLARSCKKIYRALLKNGLVNEVQMPA